MTDESRIQATLSGYWSRIWPHLTSTRYLDSAIETPTSTVRVWYAAPIPTSLAPLMADARTDGVNVVFVRPRFDRQEMSTATSTLTGALREAGIEWRSVAQGTPDGGPGAGLAVGVPNPDAELRARIHAIALTAVPHIPVMVVRDDSWPMLLG